MTYNLKKTASTATDYVVANHKLNTDTMLSFVGKSYVGYGDELQQNTLDLLCNFHTQFNDYSKAIPGQLIYDGTNLKLCTGDKTFVNLLLIPCDKAANSAPAGTVTITGILKVGETLTAANTIKDADGIEGNITYDWFLNGSAVGTGNTYVPLVTGTVIVKASYTDGLNNSESVNSSPITITAASNRLTWTITAPFEETSSNDGTVMGELTIDAHNCTFSSTYPYTTPAGKNALLRLTGVVDVMENPVNITSVDSTIISRTSTKLVVKVIFKTNSTYDFTKGTFVLTTDAVGY